MGVLLKCGAVFLHVPKTGGSWVENALDAIGQTHRRLCYKHADMTRVMHHEKFEKVKLRHVWKRWRQDRRAGLRVSRSSHAPYRFCFVRHPLTWYESWWRFLESRNWRTFGREGFAEQWHPNSPLNGLGDHDFNQFVWNVVRSRPGYVTELYSRYTEERIDFIGKQETLVDDFVHVMKQLNVDFDEEMVRNLPRENVSAGSEKGVTWDPELRALVTRLEYSALVRYGYAEEATLSKSPATSAKSMASDERANSFEDDRRAKAAA